MDAGTTIIKDPESREHQIVFICGLHRSGTSILHHILRSQRDISGFKNTGVPEDEGQHLQTVFPPARAFGGPGKFAFFPDAHMTESHPLVTEENQRRLFEQWSQYWDLNKPILVEKSPPNLIRARFLQALFPNAYFIVLTRHPLAVSYATMKWSKTDLTQLLRHWNTAHTIFDQDKASLRNLCMVSYEQLVYEPKRTLDRIGHFLGTHIHSTDAFEDHNPRYFETWTSSGIRAALERMRARQRFESLINQYGYSLKDLSKYPVFE